MPDSINNQIKILLIEDNLDQVEIIRKMLSDIKNVSFDLQHTNLISKGLKILVKGNFDLVLLDLPDSPWIDAIKKMHNCAPEVPIVVISALEDELLVAKALNWGAQDYIFKSQMTSDLLWRSIRDAVKRKQADNALWESEEKYRLLIETMSDGLCMVDIKELIIYANNQFCEMLGHTNDELVGLPVTDLLDEENQKIFREKFKGRKKGKAEPYELTITGSGGRQVTTIISPKPITDSKNNVVGSFAVVTDITERKHMEKELRASEEKFRKIFDNANIMIWGTYRDGKIKIFNKEAERVMGYSQEEALGMVNMDLHPPEEREEILEKFKHHKEGVKKKYLELGVYTKDRKTLKVLLAQATFKDAEGEDFYVALMQDITDRKQAEEALNESEEKYRVQFEDSLDGIVIADAKTGIIIDCNPAIQKLVGREKKELIGRHQLILHPPEEKDGEFSRTFKQHLIKHRGQSLDTQIITKDGQKIDVSIKADLLNVRNKSYLWGFFHDITDRKRAEEELTQHREHLEQLVKERTAELTKANKQLKQEINERKRAGEALHEEKDKAKNYLDIAGVIMLVLDVAGKITLINKKGCEILGEECLDTKCNDLIGKDWFSEFIPEKGRETIKTVFSKLMAGETIPIEYYENIVLTKTGQEKTIAWHNTVLKDKNGKILGTLSSGEDITERKYAEESLRSSNFLLSSLVESPSDVIILSVDKDFNYTFFNTAHVKEMKKVWGVDIELGKNLLDYIPSDEEREKVRKNFGQILNGKRVKRMESYGGPENKFWYELSYNPIFGEKNNVIGVTVFIVDISQNMRVQEALGKARDELEIRVKERTADLENANKELKIRNRIADIFLTTPDEEMYGEILKVILEVLDSKYGAFGYVDKNKTLICPNMTRDVWDKCQMADKNTVFPKDKWVGIWGRALNERKTLYSNKPSHVPEGHIPISRSLAVPIIHHDELIGLIHIANKSTNYTKKDKALLETLAKHIAPVLHARLERDNQEVERKRVEKKLRTYKELEKSFKDKKHNQKEISRWFDELKTVLESKKTVKENASEVLKKLKEGEYEEAEKLFTQECSDFTDGIKKAASAAFHLGNVKSQEFDYKKAAIYYTQATELSPKSSEYLNAAGKIWYELGEYRKALNYYTQAYGIDMEVYGKQHPDVAGDLNNIGGAWDSLGEYRKALDHYTKALAIDVKIYGENNLNVARDLNNIGGVWQSLEDYSKALGYFEQALAIDREFHGKCHADVAIDLNNIGGAWECLKEFRTALDFFNQALSIKKKVYGEDHPSVGTTLNNIGLCWYNLGEYNMANECLDKALAIFRAKLSEEHPYTKSASNSQAVVLANLQARNN